MLRKRIEKVPLVARTKREPAPQVSAHGIPIVKKRITKNKKTTRVLPKKTAHIQDVDTDVGRVPIRGDTRTRKKVADTVDDVLISRNPRTVLIERVKQQLALQRPLRFPIPSGFFMMRVVQYVGMFFLVFGTVLTLLHIDKLTAHSFAFLGYGNTAEITTAYNCADPMSPNYNIQYCTGSNGVLTGTTSNLHTNEQSSTTTTFSLNKSSPVTGNVTVSVTVYGASRVVLYAQNLTTDQKISLGEAKKDENLLWNFSWQTDEYHDGNYVLMANITNQYGTYSARSEIYTIQNDASRGTANTNTITTSSTTIDTTGTSTGEISGTSSVSSSGGTTTVSVTTTSPVIFLTESESVFTGKEVIRVSTQHAKAVLFYRITTGSSARTLLGYGTHYDSNEWRYYWDTTSVDDGTYSIRAVALFDTTKNTSTATTVVTVRNNEETEKILSTQNSTTTSPVISSATATANTVEAPNTVLLSPNISIRVPGIQPLHGDQDIMISVSGGLSIELYAVQLQSLTSLYLGVATQQNSTDWAYDWDTTQTPNGAYAVYAKVKNKYGVIESLRVSVKIMNETVPVYTQDQTTYLQSLKDAEKATHMVATTTTTEHVALPSNESTGGVDEVQLILKDVAVSSTTRSDIVRALDSSKTEIEKLVNTYDEAYRTHDATKMQSLKEQMTQLQKDTVAKLPVTKDRADIIDRVHAHLVETTNASIARSEQNDQIIRERIGDAITKDSDHDGISDYDEVNLYHTNAFSADTDGDGYTDGIEIMNGYDPLRSNAQTLVALQSPKDHGVVRPDVLSVHTISTIERGAESSSTGTSTPIRAIITGTGLPNSFVTLFIYSNLIVVTVKTDATGNWSYLLDKELDTGAHELYVAMTDNSGDIIAKSSPLPFVKTANAYTETDAAGAVPLVTSESASLMSREVLLIVGSIAIVVLGLVLILLGLYVRPREDTLVPNAL